MIQEDIKRLKIEYADVIGKQEDFSGMYHTQKPAWMEQAETVRKQDLYKQATLRRAQTKKLES